MGCQQRCRAPPAVVSKQARIVIDKPKFEPPILEKESSMHQNQILNHGGNNEPEYAEMYILHQNLEWCTDQLLYGLAQDIAWGEMPISQLRKFEKWNIMLGWFQRQMDTIEVVKTYERSGLELGAEQLDELREAFWMVGIGEAWIGQGTSHQILPCRNRAEDTPAGHFPVGLPVPGQAKVHGRSYWRGGLRRTCGRLTFLED